MTTLRHIAKLTGVSAQTVSRILRGQAQNHNPQTAQRVLKAAKELNYQPNLTGQVLLSGKSKTLALITRGFGGRQNLPRFEAMVDCARQAGYLLYVVSLRSPDNIEEELITTLRDLAARRVDGLVVYQAATMSPATQTFFKKLTIPTVFLDAGPGNWANKVTFDRQSGIDELAAHLASLGHKHAAFISAAVMRESTNHKARLYQTAFAAAGITLDTPSPLPVAIESASLPEHTGYISTLAYLKLKTPATAILTGDDDTAVGAMAAIRELGLVVPRDISIAGFNDSPGAGYTAPALTTVHAPRAEVGATVISMLTGLIDKSASKTPQHVSLPTNLVVRASTGPVPVGPAASHAHSADVVSQNQVQTKR
jgi:DNA-binding LacI/PurR family transcriptional regulator